jgi:hypothetical protein
MNNREKKEFKERSEKRNLALINGAASGGPRNGIFDKKERLALAYEIILANGQKLKPKKSIPPRLR